MSLKKPALEPMSLAPRTSSGYPEPYRSRVLPREKRALGDALGLKTIGINHTVLPPGKESSMRHWHTHEEEFIYVLSGEVVLRTDAGEQVLAAGMCAGFPVAADVTHGDGHQLINRGSQPAVYLEVSNRDPRDTAYYSDVDLHFHGHGAAVRFTRKDGSPF
ncbi:MAG TPA: cupin domain-containing protein [Steroidobacteraceae bacterium]|nr:cupin domain-containing protein [Steroidobacteraceae bacterium]